MLIHTYIHQREEKKTAIFQAHTKLHAPKTGHTRTDTHTHTHTHTPTHTHMHRHNALTPPPTSTPTLSLPSEFPICTASLPLSLYLVSIPTPDHKHTRKAPKYTHGGEGAQVHSLRRRLKPGFSNHHTENSWSPWTPKDEVSCLESFWVLVRFHVFLRGITGLFV